MNDVRIKHRRQCEFQELSFTPSRRTYKCKLAGQKSAYIHNRESKLIKNKNDHIGLKS